MEFHLDSLKIWSSRTDLWPELRKESDWRTSWLCSGIELLIPKTVELFSLPMSVLPLLPVLHQSWSNKKSQTFLDLFRWNLLSFKCLSVSIVSVWSPHIFISRLFSSCALLFGLSFRGTISDTVTAFVSNFRDSARSMNNLDIWLAVLLLLSSFVLTCNIMWFGLNSRMVRLTWS